MKSARRPVGGGSEGGRSPDPAEDARAAGKSVAVRSAAVRSAEGRSAEGRSAEGRSAEGKDAEAARWTFLTNYSHVLVLLFRDPSMVLRDVAAQVGITERAVQRIIADLEAGGYIEREKVGRQNRYRIRTDLPLRHPIESDCSIGELLRLFHRQT